MNLPNQPKRFAGSSVTSLEIRLLTKEDDRSGFSSGNVALDTFFHKYAGQNQFRHKVGVTYVAVDLGRIIGYVTISAGSINPRHVAAMKLPPYDAPALFLGRMAVSQSSQGNGVGSALLRFVCCRAVQMSHDYGCVGILVDSKPDAVGFYGKYGFVPFEYEDVTRSEQQTMILKISAVEKLVSPSASATLSAAAPRTR